MSKIVEKDWITKAGLRAAVVIANDSHRCGYVGVTKEHVLYGVDYMEESPYLELPEDTELGQRGILPLFAHSLGNGSLTNLRPEIYFNVHGSLTYSGMKASYPVENEGLWWFGYDCGHAGDRTKHHQDGEERTLEFCVEQCESLAWQLAEVQG